MRFLAAVAAVILFSQTVFAGPRVTGNGGDVVLCDGTYKFQSIDYVIGVAASSRFSVAPVENLASSFHRIGRLLREKSPRLGRSFSRFSYEFDSTAGGTRRYVWSATDEPDLGARDKIKEFLLLPVTCKGSTTTPAIRQVVHRTRQGREVNFEYEHDMLFSLEPLQLSFVLVHEWLWDFTLTTEQNRRLNVLLHSRDFDTLSPAAFEAILAALGVDPDRYAQ